MLILFEWNLLQHLLNVVATLKQSFHFQKNIPKDPKKAKELKETEKQQNSSLIHKSQSVFNESMALVNFYGMK